MRNGLRYLSTAVSTARARWVKVAQPSPYNPGSLVSTLTTTSRIPAGAVRIVFTSVILSGASLSAGGGAAVALLGVAEKNQGRVAGAAIAERVSHWRRFMGHSGGGMRFCACRAYPVVRGGPAALPDFKPSCSMAAGRVLASLRASIVPRPRNRGNRSRRRMSVAIRRLHEDDADAVLRLAHLAGWNQTVSDVRRLFVLEPDGCFAACVDDQVVGTTTTTCYGTTLAWVGMVLVGPEFRRQGMASALMDRALDYLRDRGVVTMKCDATPVAQPVCERLGFEPDAPLERWEGEPTHGSGGATESGGHEGLAAIDHDAFGADRAELLRMMIADTGHAPVIVRNGQREVIGYALNRPGSRAGYVGPVIADSHETAERLIKAVLVRMGSGRVFIDVNPGFPGATDLVRGLGFTRQRELLRMRLGPAMHADNSRRVLAIAGPEVG